MLYRSQPRRHTRFFLFYAYGAGGKKCYSINQISHSPLKQQQQKSTLVAHVKHEDSLSVLLAQSTTKGLNGAENKHQSISQLFDTKREQKKRGPNCYILKTEKKKEKKTCKDKFI